MVFRFIGGRVVFELECRRGFILFCRLGFWGKKR